MVAVLPKAFSPVAALARRLLRHQPKQLLRLKNRVLPSLVAAGDEVLKEPARASALASNNKSSFGHGHRQRSCSTQPLWWSGTTKHRFGKRRIALSVLRLETKGGAARTVLFL